MSEKENMTEIQDAQVQHIPGICKNCCWFHAGKHEIEGDPAMGLCRKSAPKTCMIGEMNLPDQDARAQLRVINEHVFQSDTESYPCLFQFFTEPIWPKVFEEDFCGKFKCADWVRRKDRQGMLLPVKVIYRNHPDYRKLFPRDDDAST